MDSVNPANGEILASFPGADEHAIERALAHAATAAPVWSKTAFADRAGFLRSLAANLHKVEAKLARFGVPYVDGCVHRLNV